MKTTSKKKILKGAMPTILASGDSPKGNNAPPLSRVTPTRHSPELGFGLPRNSVEAVIQQLIKLLGEDPEREGLIETPRRVAQSYQKLLSGYHQNLESMMTVFDNEGYDEMVIAKEIEFYSLCEHHLLPFFGKVHVGYIPGDKIIGLSKMPRLIEVFSRRMQTQERLTSQVAQGLMDLLQPKGVGVVIEARHLCMMARGVEKQNSVVTTSTLRGLFKKNLNTRSEFLRLIGKF